MSRHASGFKAWLLQRISAVYLGLFSVYAFVYLAWFAPASFGEWKAWVLSTPVMISMLVLVFLLLIHAWIGIRDVLIDYIPIIGIRILALSLVGIGLVACGFWSILIFVSARLI